MNRQELFNKAATHLLKQNKQALADEPDPGCQYRASNGLTCAIGCLIPDELYDPLIENNTVIYLFGADVAPNDKHRLPDNIVKKFKDYFNPSHSDILFLTKLQELHDYAEPYAWSENLRKFANTYNLNTDCLEQNNG